MVEQTAKEKKEKINVYLPNDSRKQIGGGWTFKRNFQKGAKQTNKLQIVDSVDNADISLIVGASMILPETFTKVKEKTKVVLRVDGVPELWRNHRHTWDRFKYYFKKADGIVYQSGFVESTTGLWLKQLTGSKAGVIIMNGVDKDIFKPEGDSEMFTGSPRYLNVNSRKDPNKRIEEVIHYYREKKLKNPDAFMVFVGKYPTYLRENDFGLYDYKQGKDWVYLGMVENLEYLAKIMRGADKFLFPSFADPCPNVLIEALHVMGEDNIELVNEVGGTLDIALAWRDNYDFSLENMANNYYDYFSNLLNV